MKNTILPLLALGFAAIVSPSLVSAQKVVPDKPIYVGGVGPAVSGSEPISMLPEPALVFIVENYPAAGIIEMEKEFADNSYEVRLTGGTELEFDSKGNIKEVDAADGQFIPAEVVKAVLPASAYTQLQSKNAVTNVESIECKADCVKVECLCGGTETEYSFALN